MKSGQFSGNTDYNLTLEGHQEGESSVALQIVSGLTLFLIPYRVNEDHDLRYVLEHVATGRRFEATASDRYTVVVGLLLAPASPFLLGGVMRTWERLGNHLYQQLADQGAFDPASWPTEELLPPPQAEEVAPPPVPPPTTPSDTIAPAPPSAVGDDPAAQRLRRLEELRGEGLISQDEYERKRNEILDDL